jgi:hypothetical protein
MGTAAKVGEPHEREASEAVHLGVRRMDVLGQLVDKPRGQLLQPLNAVIHQHEKLELVDAGEHGEWSSEVGKRRMRELE